MAEATADEEQEAPPKESSMGFYLAILIATVIAAGSGWFLGGMLTVSPKVQKEVETEINAGVGKKPETDGKGKAKGDEKASKSGDEKKGGYGENGLVTLEPILVALRNSNNAFLRLELVLVMNKGAYLEDEESKVRLISELSAFSKTMTLKQISGPSGYLHFREDLVDRARLSTNGDVKDVLIMSMVAE